MDETVVVDEVVGVVVVAVAFHNFGAVGAAVDMAGDKEKFGNGGGEDALRPCTRGGVTDPLAVGLVKSCTLLWLAGGAAVDELTKAKSDDKDDAEGCVAFCLPALTSEAPTDGIARNGETGIALLSTG